MNNLEREHITEGRLNGKYYLKAGRLSYVCVLVFSSKMLERPFVTGFPSVQCGSRK